MPSAHARPVVGISLGDPSGIGPEVTFGALASPRVRRALLPVIYADASTADAAGLARFDRVEGPLAERPRRPTLVVVTRLSKGDRRPGKPSLKGGRAQYQFIRSAIDDAKTGHLDALCTAPVSKEQISRAGIPFMGHTEVLAEAFGREVLMLMDGPRIRVALATNHVPLTQVAARLSVDGLVSQLMLLSSSLRPLVGRAPKLAVCGLNPHAGEGGLLGREEVEVIGPAVQRARARGVRVDGPLPADGLFARAQQGLGYDAVLAMFHDQGLVVAKALDFDLTVNVTLGLPVPRTSPDHGTAYDIAGRGVASAEPMIAALLKAAALASGPKRPGAVSRMTGKASVRVRAR